MVLLFCAAVTGYVVRVLPGFPREIMPKLLEGNRRTENKTPRLLEVLVTPQFLPGRKVSVA
jgi:hypothetical protein